MTISSQTFPSFRKRGNVKMTSDYIGRSTRFAIFAVFIWGHLAQSTGVLQSCYLNLTCTKVVSFNLMLRNSQKLPHKNLLGFQRGVQRIMARSVCSSCVALSIRLQKLHGYPKTLCVKQDKRSFWIFLIQLQLSWILWEMSKMVWILLKFGTFFAFRCYELRLSTRYWQGNPTVLQLDSDYPKINLYWSGGRIGGDSCQKSASSDHHSSRILLF